MEWHPVQSLVADEWHLRAGITGLPAIIIRRMEFGERGSPEIYYRAVTFASTSVDRRLVGYFPTIEGAAAAAWAYMNAVDAERHAIMSTRAQELMRPGEMEARMNRAGMLAVRRMSGR